MSGWYHLCLLKGRALPVFCDLDTKEGGWLVSVRETPGLPGWPSGHFFLLAPRGSQSPLELRHSLKRFTDQCLLSSQRARRNLSRLLRGDAI